MVDGSHSLPTRRSSDLGGAAHGRRRDGGDAARPGHAASPPSRDRKSTRLNSSHVATSYAVFSLREKEYDPIFKTTVKPCLTDQQSAHIVAYLQTLKYRT